MTTEKKRQHYVPQFYLRNFSPNADGKSLAFFNTGSEKHVTNAAVETQAFENYFYGKDGKIEDALSEIEGDTAPIISAILQSSSCPLSGTDDHRKLVYFIILMESRNPVASGGILESQDLMQQYIENSSGGEVTIDPSQLLTEESAIKMSLRQMKFGVAFCNDLKCKLLINRTKTPFITSDNPLVKYNQFLEGRKWPSSGVGFGSIGIQLFLPLSPTVSLICYDDMTYRIGDKKKHSIELTAVKEIDQLNTLQVLNCDTTLFGSEAMTKQYVLGLIKGAARFLKANEQKLIPMAVENEFGNPLPGEVLNNTSTECRIGLTIPGITQTKAAKQYRMKTTGVQLRKKAEPLMQQFFGHY